MAAAVVGVAVMAPGALGHTAGGQAVTFCFGDASLSHQRSCVNGTHAYRNPFTLAFNISPSVPGAAHGYTGSLEGRMAWALDTFIVGCDYVHGTELPIHCWSSGLRPPPGVSFTYTCSSYDLGTQTLGGTGFWRCWVQHDTVTPLP